MDQNINDSNSHIWNSFSENIILGIQPFYIRPHIPVDIIRVFFNFRFSCSKSQSQQKLAKNISPLILQYSFAQKTSPILRTLTHLTLKTICSRNTVNSVLTFPANMFPFGARKNICTASFLDTQEPHP